MKKEKIILLIFLFSFIFGTYAQENKITRPIDDKFRISPEKVKKHQEYQKNKDFIFPSENDYKDVEVHAAINPLDTNNIIVSWLQIQLVTASMQLYFTENFGETWNESEINFVPRDLLPTESIIGGGDPLIVFDNSGNAYISWIYVILNIETKVDYTYEIYMVYAKSTDKGATWQRADNDHDIITHVVCSNEGIMPTGVASGIWADKQWMAADTQSDKIYMTATEFDESGNYDTGLEQFFIRTLQEDGTEFGSKTLIPHTDSLQATLGSLAVDADGDIHVVVPNFNVYPDDKEFLTHYKSDNQGETWSEANYIARVEVANFKGLGLSAPADAPRMYERLYPASYIAIDTCSSSPYKDRLYVVWNSNDLEYEYKVDIFLSYSDDDGTTWSEPQKIHSEVPKDGEFHHRPTIYVNPKGIIVVGYYDNRDGEINENTNENHYYVGVSVNGGQHFSENSITETSFNYFDAYSVNEYYQILATENNVIAFYAAYDGDDNEIYYSIFPLDDVTDIKEIQPLTTQMSVKNIYPNPVTDILSIDIVTKQNTSFNYQIYNTEGKLVKQGIETKYSIGNNNKEISVNDLEIGIYYISFNTEWGVFVKKFIKK